MKKEFKYITYLLASVISLGGIVNYGLPEKNTNILQASVLPALQAINESLPNEDPDLAIQKITLKQIDSPSGDFNYYKYKATLVIHNFGGNVKNRVLTINSGENQKFAFIKNTPDGFSLMKDQNYIIDNYEVVFDGKYNGGNLRFKIDLVDVDDANESNNEYVAKVFSGPAKIQNFEIENVSNDGEIVIDFMPPSEDFPRGNWEFFVSEKLDLANVKEKYAQIYLQENLYEYLQIENSQEILDKGSWAKTVLKEADGSLNFTIANNPFENQKKYFVYFKATNPETGNFIASDVIGIIPQNPLTKSAFAKFFVDYAGVDIDDTGDNPFDDVDRETWYAPYVQTLYNSGLLGIDHYLFYPDQEISRGEVLKMVMDYFDFDFKTLDGAPHFKDVGEDNFIYPYAESFYAADPSNAFKNYLNSDLPATKNYVKYIIDVSKENN